MIIAYPKVRAKIEKLEFLIANADVFDIDTHEFLATFADCLELVERRESRTFSGVRAALPHQLDRTHRDDFYDEQAWLHYHKTKERNCSVSQFGQRLKQGSLSQWADLCPCSTGAKRLYSPNNRWGVIPELSGAKKRRCIFVSGTTGARCLKYARTGVLSKRHERHKNYVTGYLRSHGVLDKVIQNKKLKDMFDEFLHSDARNITGEIALMRTMLASLCSNFKEHLEPDKLPFELIDAVVKITDKVTRTVERYDAMQHKLGLLITPDQVQLLMYKMLQLITSVVRIEPEQLNTIAHLMEQKLTLNVPAGTRIENGKVDYTYGIEPPEQPVKFTNACTRYSPDGRIRQVPQKTEFRRAIEADKHLGFDQNKVHLPTDEIAEHTTVGGTPVQIGDDFDPFFFPEDLC